MNIVYKFTSKITGNFYIGSKSECTVIDGDIICNKKGTKYFSSSSSDKFWDEVKDGNMELLILEEVPDRSKLLEIEAKYQIEVDAKNNPKCYNKVIATDIRNIVDQEQWDKTINIYGETLITKCKNNSRVARLNSAAVKEGFLNYGYKVFEYLTKYEELASYTKVDRFFNKNKYSRRFLNGLKLLDFESEINLTAVHKHLINGASFIKALEESNQLLHVILLKGYKTFNLKLDVIDYIAVKNNLPDRPSLGKEILKLYIKGYTIKSISKQFPELSDTSVSRIVQEEVSKRLDINDI